MAKTQYITTDEAAARLGITVRAVRKLVTEEKLPALQIANRILIDPADVERLRKKQEDIATLLTIAQAAERIGVSPRRVGHLIEQKRIAVKRVVGRQFYLDPVDVDAFLAERDADSNGLLTPATAARRRHVSRQHIVNLINKGKLPAKKRGNVYMIKPEDVDALELPAEKRAAPKHDEAMLNEVTKLFVS